MTYLNIQGFLTFWRVELPFLLAHAVHEGLLDPEYERKKIRRNVGKQSLKTQYHIPLDFDIYQHRCVRL